MMKPQSVIAITVQQMVCTSCGAEANATCSCGKPYVPKKQQAEDAVRATPNKSDRAISADTGLARTTIQRAREEVEHRGGPHGPPEREGRDGKVYRLPVRDDEPDGEIELEHEEGLRVIAARGFLNRANEAKEIATLGKLVASDITEAMIAAADEAAAAWNLAAQNLRRLKSNG